MDFKLPMNSWELYLDTINKADKTLTEILDNRPIGPLLDQFIHLLVFHQGVCAARWINNNIELARRLNSIQSFTREEFEELATLVGGSVEKLKITDG